ncbi:Ger(x)C family spore germination protein [Paenibacillus sp. MZ04-78.2]|uniref:Ger(x)C family spore germination protein n=1 Tax=Paenibacillus sp. MZ04-78.2 TaxID=2962034 RepID=UPI0020B776B6|nr:Ger(x)C family spore germination protein [Paenibacillus sp. MZ04-78.2]MCP3772974.1 Ger(x)C family spore germination protein [Paenibacillus sp. MZ04-78.2]
MMILHRTMAMFLILLVILLSGCWDRREIELIGMVVGIALDKAESSSENEIIMTQQFVNTTKGGKEETVKAYNNITGQGKSIFQIIRETSNRTDKSPYFMHLKVIVISDKLASTLDLTDLTDLFLRDHEVRRTVQILFVPGNARKVLEMKSDKKGIPSIVLWGTTKNDYKTSEMPRLVTLGDLSENLTAKKSFLAQKLIPLREEVKLRGAAVISGKKKTCIGWLSADETSGINWILGTRHGSRGGIVKIVDENSRKELVYEIDYIRSKIVPVVKRDRLSFRVSIDSEGYLGENWTKESSFEQDFIHKVNQLTAKQIKHLVLKALNKTKDTYKVDVAGFAEQLKIHNYNTWKQYKDDWDEKFSETKVDVDVKVSTRGFGTRGSKVTKIE